MSKAHQQTNDASDMSLAELMVALRRMLIDRMKKQFMTEDFTFSQMEVVWFIDTDGKKSMDSIAQHLGISAPSVSVMINKMEKKGIVVGKRDLKDRRVVHIELSSKTKKQMLAISKQKEKFFHQMTSKLNTTDKKHLQRIIKILVSE
jgi:DNA-binding MarR family transcriptional regulator